MSLPDDRTETPNLIGRESELEVLEGWFASPTGLLVVSGHGGLGTTALARQFAASKRSLFVDLSSATSFDHVLFAIGDAAKLALDERPTVRGLEEALKKRGVSLLVLDNIEQLADEIQSLTRLSTLASHLLLTSRVSTGLPFEMQLALEPLAIAEDWSAAAIRLLRKHTTSEGQPTSQDAASLALYTKIATITDGIPLALELAATHIAKVGPALAASQLDDHLLNVSNAATSHPDRHRTMEDSIEWSWRNLASEDQRALVALSLFAGSFRFEEAIDLFAGTLDSVEDRLDRLTSMNFLVNASDRGGSFRLLVPIREFLRRKLEKSVLEESFAAYSDLILARVGREVVPYFGTTRTQSVFVLERWRADLVQIALPPLGLPQVPGHVYLVEEALGRLALAGGSVSSYLAIFGNDGQKAAFEALSDAKRASWLRMRAYIERAFGDLSLAQRLAEEAIELTPANDRDRIAALTTAASIASSVGDAQYAYARGLEALELCGELRAEALECEAAFALGFAAQRLGYMDEARRVIEQGYAVARKLQANWSLLRYPSLYVAILVDFGRLDLAGSIARTSIEESPHWPILNASMRLALADILTLQKKFDEAEIEFEKAFEVAMHGEVVRLAAEILREKTRFLLVRGDLDSLAPAIERAVETHASSNEMGETHAFRAIVLARAGSHADAEKFAHSVREEGARDAAGAIARAILLFYELLCYERENTSAHKTAVEESLAMIFSPDDRGATWYRKSADARLCFMASVGLLEKFGFETLAARDGNIVLEVPQDLSKRFARLGRITIDNIPLAAFRILMRLAARQPPTLSLDLAFEVGWPGEVAHKSAIRNRVHVAMSFLRKNFLGELLVRDDVGYHLHDRVLVSSL